ncbi:MFS transporter [Mycolicibacterium aubagnense]|uniref:MFS transporter n=1 Tax=Mycolicibacterium aubagnense TaxID=319707 RepID=A0ABM7IDF3_9MYCO|nr:YbfB/YjiJ family MFS transporter [Mycolicibacterium aubagnense]WGI33581.1 YbfB/YjiJ family MFS transporter [Mycolicibacterium aubagnense]BBX84676.1 MFS transporter [Mycolicibacterium aubagnense]
MPNAAWLSIARAAAALAAAMGIGRFAYTPILPLMTAHAGLTAQAAGQLATANYVGYLIGALGATASPRLARSVTACRASLVMLIASLAAMALSTNVIEWGILRLIAGIASALVFVIAVNTLLDHGHPAHHAGWAFSGVGIGIALSAALPAGNDWQGAWWAATALAALLSVFAWFMRPGVPDETSKASAGQANARGPLIMLMTSYTLEGVGYIIAGTFLVAAVTQQSPGGLGSAVWLLVGLAAAPSAALWARFTGRFSYSALLVAALLLQAAGIAWAGTGNSIAALAGAILFGGTFIGISTLALAAGRALQFPGAVALLTTGYSVGQIVGPVAVAPLLHNGFQQALLAGAAVVLLAALAALLMWISGRQPRVVSTDGGDVTGERVDDGMNGRIVFSPSPHQ